MAELLYHSIFFGQYIFINPQPVYLQLIQRQGHGKDGRTPQVLNNATRWCSRILLWFCFFKDKILKFNEQTFMIANSDFIWNLHDFFWPLLLLNFYLFIVGVLLTENSQLILLLLEEISSNHYQNKKQMETGLLTNRTTPPITSFSKQEEAEVFELGFICRDSSLLLHTSYWDSFIMASQIFFNTLLIISFLSAC